MIHSMGNDLLKKFFIAAFFLSLFVTGVTIYKDYGLSWDEHFNLENGTISYNYVFHDDNTLLNHRDRDYGMFFELVLIVVQKIFKPNELRDIYFLRHLCTFLLFFVSVCFFYLLCSDYFKNWGIALLGCLFLILSPRIFAHSFYNSKDIAFLAVFIISTYSMIRFLNKRTLSMLVWHSFSSAVLIDIRILGVLIPCLTIFFFFFSRHEKGEFSLYGNTAKILVYAMLAYGFMILFWPYLWTNPTAHFIEAFVNMKHFRWDSPVLFLGQFHRASELPKYYIPVWILISTPMLHMVFFFIGLSASAYMLIQHKINLNIRHVRDTLIFLIWFFSPIIAVIVLDSIIYDSWRHLFFIYPALIIISMNGFAAIFRMKNHTSSNGMKFILQSAVIIILIIGLFDPFLIMIKLHPYQNIYFSPIAGRNMTEIKQKFELDYWGLSYRRALEYILQNDPSKKIKIMVNEESGKNAREILSDENRRRIVYVDDLNQAKYFISTFRWHPEEYPFKNEIFAIKIGGAKIIVAYRLH